MQAGQAQLHHHQFGIDGFCTGKVVAMGSTAKLHASGKNFLGHPCIEHRGPVLDLVPLGDYTAKGMYMAKAWKDRPRAGQHEPARRGGAVGGSKPGRRPVANPGSRRTRSNAAQGPAANFTLPSVVVPKISAPLLKLPAGFSLPVFTIPIGNRTLQRVLALVPDLTALPTLVTARVPQANISVTTAQVTLPEVTVPNLGELAESFGVPHMPRLPPLSNMSFSDAITQWVVARQISMPVATVQLPEIKLRSLHDLIPDFQVPCLVVPNISLPLLHLPKSFPLHVAAIPNDGGILKALEAIFPRGKLTSLPAFVTAAITPLGMPGLPLLSLRNITIPTIEQVAIEVGAAPPKWANIDLEKMAQQLSTINWKVPSLPAPLQYMQPPTLNFTLPSITIPDISMPPLPQVQLPSLPGMPKPNLTRISAALSSMPDIAADISQWPKLIDQWKAKLLSRPFDFNLSTFAELVTPIEQAGGDGMEISFEVPNVMAQWMAGTIQKLQLPELEVQDEAQLALKSMLPQLPQLPALLVVNTSAPYFNAGAGELQEVPIVMVPDSMAGAMTVRPFLVTIGLLVLAAAPCVLGCKTTASPFFGVPWKSAFAMYSTENGWNRHGGVSKINLYYNKESGCLTGLRITYGNQGESARLLGVDRVGQATAELRLDAKELVSDAVVKYSSCITFLSLATNKRKVLAIGQLARRRGGFLAYMKAYTDDAGYGTLQRLQLVWATLDCASSPAKGHSRCALNGMGKDVLTMMCFGTNIAPNPILDATTGNPCTNLACKLDKPNCTSAGLLGLGGFCSGKVVAMGSTAKLHPVGQNFVGYPCVERKGAVLDLLPVGDYTARGTYAAKAWKVCDCIQGFAIHQGSIGVLAQPDGDISLTLPGLPTLPHFPFLAKGLLNMSLPDVLAQWVGANQANAQLPQVELSPKQIREIEIVLPGFMAPSVIVSKLSAPLFKKPTNFRLPVFTPPFGNNTLKRLSLAIPDLTSLPTLLLPRLDRAVMPTVTVTVPEVTIPNLLIWPLSLACPRCPSSLLCLTCLSKTQSCSGWQQSR
ncbi:hypothetical protein COO60DRAFT_1625305 [Scenedesmus sp. NREL 46B-D3]|nr:hypothetical protein COO60DRAFT_1625305 [Scenedesmus sp. NREL 46B-D3]